VFESLSPAGYVQEEVIERLALLLWRQRRVSRYETDMIILARELAEEDWAHGQRAQTGDQRPPELLPATIRRHLDRTRCNQQLLERVLVLPDGTRVDADDALAVLTCVCDQTEGVKLSDLPLPAIPDGLATEQSDSWTMGQVRGVLESIANLAGQSASDLVNAALAHTRTLVAELSSKIERAETDVSRLRRERVLAPESVIDRIIRYEAHLSEQIAAAMQEFHMLRS